MLNDFFFLFFLDMEIPALNRSRFIRRVCRYAFIFSRGNVRRSNSSGRTIMQMQAKSRKNAEGNYVNGREWNKTATGLLGTAKFKIQSLVTLISLSLSLFVCCYSLAKHYLCEMIQEILKKFFFWTCILKILKFILKFFHCVKSVSKKII